MFPTPPFFISFPYTFSFRCMRSFGWCLWRLWPHTYLNWLHGSFDCIHVTFLSFLLSGPPISASPPFRFRFFLLVFPFLRSCPRFLRRCLLLHLRQTAQFPVAYQSPVDINFQFVYLCSLFLFCLCFDWCPSKFLSNCNFPPLAFFSIIKKPVSDLTL